MKVKMDRDVTKILKRVGKSLSVGVDEKGRWFAQRLSERVEKSMLKIPQSEKKFYKDGCVVSEASDLAQEIFDRGLKATKQLQLA